MDTRQNSYSILFKHTKPIKVMNKNVILSALQSQLQTIKAAAVKHEQDVYEPAVAKLTAKIESWFATHVMDNLHSVAITSDSIVIKPSDSTGYGNDITINYRASWRRDGNNDYFTTYCYRPDIDSREDNSNAVHYYNAMASIASTFESICNEYKTKWLPAIAKLNSAKEDKYSEIYGIEREIRTCETEIAELEKEIYNQSGFECTLKPYANYTTNYDSGECVYTKREDAYHIKAFYGRSKWDYAYINSFKVVSFPKAKHAKVVLEWKCESDDKTRTVELNKTRYAEFVNEVYYWQTSRADQRDAEINDRISRYNEKATA